MSLLHTANNPLLHDLRAYEREQIGLDDLLTKCYRWAIENLHQYKAYKLKYLDKAYSKKILWYHADNYGTYRWLREIESASNQDKLLITEEESSQLVRNLSEFYTQVKKVEAWLRELTPVKGKRKEQETPLVNVRDVILEEG